MLPLLPCRPEKGLTFYRYPNPALHDTGRGKYNRQLKLTNIASFYWALVSVPVQHKGECPQVASAKTKLPTAITIQRHGHIFHFTHSNGRFNSLTATRKIPKTEGSS